MGRRGLQLSEASRRALLDHAWPGNVRELQNCLERSAILVNGLVIEPEHLRLVPALAGGPTLQDVLDLTGSLGDVVKRATAMAEEEAIALALKDSGGDHARAAERLGVSLATLNRRLRQRDGPAVS
jgi:two-component system NtrC family response regulator